MKKLFIALSFLFLTYEVIAGTQPTFEELDINSDGILSEHEVSAALLNIEFNKADVNQDGGLDRKEFAQAVKMQEQKQKDNDKSS